MIPPAFLVIGLGGGRLWLPVFILWPLLFALLIVAFAVLIPVAVVLTPFGYGRPAILAVPLTLRILSAMSGLTIDIESPDGGFFLRLI